MSQLAAAQSVLGLASSALSGFHSSFSPHDNLLVPTIQGVFQGSIYGLVGLGLVLIYKSNRIFNFAQGEFGTVAVLVANAGLLGRLFGWHMPYFVACLVGLAAGTLTALLTERLVIRPLFNRPKVILTVGTVGVTILLVAVETLAVKQANTFPSFSDTVPSLHRRPYWFRIVGYAVTYQQVLSLVMLGVLAVGAGLFFKRTATGVAILAVSQEPTAAELAGISVKRISLVTWGLAGFLGSVAGLLLGPIVSPVAPGFVTGTALFTGFTAAVIGGMTSLSGAFVGGILIGVLEKLASTDNLEKLGIHNVPGTDLVAIFLVLLLVLLIRPKGLFGKEV